MLKFQVRGRRGRNTFFRHPTSVSQENGRATPDRRQSDRRQFQGFTTISASIRIERDIYAITMLIELSSHHAAIVTAIGNILGSSVR